MASQNGRYDILERRVALKVDLSTADTSSKTPLLYATSNVDTMSIYLLLENGAQANGGSLQEAVRLCQKDNHIPTPCNMIMIQSNHAIFTKEEPLLENCGRKPTCKAESSLPRDTRQ